MFALFMARTVCICTAEGGAFRLCSLSARPSRGTVLAAGSSFGKQTLRQSPPTKEGGIVKNADKLRVYCRRCAFVSKLYGCTIDYIIFYALLTMKKK